MGMHVRGGMLLAVLSAVSVMSGATPLSAQWFSGGCRTCQQPMPQCHCQSHQPVVQTPMVPRQVMTYRNEVVTQYRQEAITQNVPVTTYHDVVVDEGSYQTVYVPKQVTKRIPQVSYQPQVAYRSVPYQVTRQVPQVVTQMVSPVVPCGPCGGLAFAPTPIYQTVPAIGQVVLGRPVIASNPVTMLSPTSATPSVATTAATDSYSPQPVPDPKFTDSPGATSQSWTRVGSRNDGRSADNDSASNRTSSNNGVRFKPARMVFQNWESQSRIAAGEGPERR